jgi:outer membrane protein assembly factor BamB
MSRRLLVAVILVFPAVGRADWPHVRGPTYDAHAAEAGLADSWPADGPPVLWAKELGQGYSGTVVADGKLVTQFQTNTGQYVLALDPDTGAELWRRRVDLPWQPVGAYPGPYATPTVADGHVYFATPTGLVGCLTAADGRAVWEVNLRTRFGPAAGTGFGYAATPCVEAGRVILPVGAATASVVALSTADGSTLWAAGTDPASYCPILPITLGGRRLAVAFLQNSLALHDPATGERVWRERLSAHYDEHSAWPLYAEPHLLVASPFRVGAQLFRLDAAATRTVWSSRVLSNDVCSSVLDGGFVYGFDLHQSQSSPHRTSRGVFKCVEFLTGKERWLTEDVGQATALVADGKLVLLTDTGELVLARVNPDRYEELARARVLGGGLCWTPPALWNGRLYARNQSKIVCVHLGRAAPAGPVSRAAVEGPPFDWSRLLGREPDYPHDDPTPDDVRRWYAWCVLGVFVPAGVLGAIAGRGAFAATAFVLGLVGTPLFSRWAEAFVLTWPASLYVAFRVALAVADRAGSRPRTTRTRATSGGVTLLFLGLCLGYYRLCVVTGYVMAWGFLAGFLPAAPFAVVAVGANRRWVRTLADAAGFAVYFWASGLLPGWKARVVDG